MMSRHIPSEKITLSFPADLLEKVKERIDRGEVSRFVAEATREKLEAEERALLREELKKGYIARAGLHRELAEEFYDAEEEAYRRQIGHGEAQRKTKTA
jgi:metal-responsive CopG/Arc/MetJ family transcriptional regulator